MATTMLTYEHVALALQHSITCDCSTDCRLVKRAFATAAASATQKLPLGIRGLVAQTARDGGKFTAQFECTLDSKKIAPDVRILAGFGSTCDTCLGCLPCRNCVMTTLPLNPLEMSIAVSVLVLRRGLDAGRLKYRDDPAAREAEAQLLYNSYFMCSIYPGIPDGSGASGTTGI
jgi:hypothetical protein